MCGKRPPKAARAAATRLSPANTISLRSAKKPTIRLRNSSARKNRIKSKDPLMILNTIMMMRTLASKLRTLRTKQTQVPRHTLTHTHTHTHTTPTCTCLFRKFLSRIFFHIFVYSILGPDGEPEKNSAGSVMLTIGGVIVGIGAIGGVAIFFIRSYNKAKYVRTLSKECLCIPRVQTV